MLFWIGIIAGLLLLAPVVFSVLKRSASEANPRLWFAIHIAASACGFTLALVHSGGELWSPPALLLLLLVLIIGLGTWVRLTLGPAYAARMGARPLAFVRADPDRRARLRELLDQKIDLLKALDPTANEAAFSPLLGHWFAHPLKSWRYFRLMEAERALTGARGDAGTVLSWSRRLHMALAALFVGGLAVHFAVAMFWPES